MTVVGYRCRINGVGLMLHPKDVEVVVDDCVEALRSIHDLPSLDDGWTLVPDSAPDSRRYAGLGDAVTATVGHWLGDRIRAADEAAA